MPHLKRRPVDGYKPRLVTVDVRRLALAKPENPQVHLNVVIDPDVDAHLISNQGTTPMLSFPPDLGHRADNRQPEPPRWVRQVNRFDPQVDGEEIAEVILRCRSTHEAINERRERLRPVPICEPVLVYKREIPMPSIGLTGAGGASIQVGGDLVQDALRDQEGESGRFGGPEKIRVLLFLSRQASLHKDWEDDGRVKHQAATTE